MPVFLGGFDALQSGINENVEKYKSNLNFHYITQIQSVIDPVPYTETSNSVVELGAIAGWSRCKIVPVSVIIRISGNINKQTTNIVFYCYACNNINVCEHFLG